MLISTGQAKCTRSAADILEEYIPAVPTSTVIPTPVVAHIWDSIEQEMVYTAIQGGCTQIDDIAVHTGYAIHDVLGHITLLEIHGIVYTDTSRGIYIK
jgi:predicted Rossmann fold nucleotide-binding protein DprA/Smf involved in DNA uptake